MQAFENADISVAIGFAMRHPSLGLSNATAEADKKMFEHKRAMKAESS